MGMYNYTLMNLISNFQKGDEFCFEIYKVFEKLIMVYSKQDEDMKQELTLFLIELLRNINLSKFVMDDSINLQKYIAVCLKNKYIAILKENNKHIQNVITVDISECIFPHFDNTNVILDDALNYLTSPQRKVIVYYLHKYTISEISQMLGISRQAVNQMKNRSFKILNKYFQ